MKYTGRGTTAVHWHQLNVKLLSYLAPMLCVGAMIVRLRLNLSQQEAEPPNTHFQAEPGNESFKSFEAQVDMYENCCTLTIDNLYLQPIAY